MIFHKLSPCSSKNLNYHIFFRVGSLPKLPPQNILSKVGGALPRHKGVTRLGAKEDKDRPVTGSSSVISSCHEITPEKDLLPGSDLRKGGPICASNDPTQQDRNQVLDLSQHHVKQMLRMTRLQHYLPGTGARLQLEMTGISHITAPFNPTQPIQNHSETQLPFSSHPTSPAQAAPNNSP